MFVGRSEVLPPGALKLSMVHNNRTRVMSTSLPQNLGSLWKQGSRKKWSSKFTERKMVRSKQWLGTPALRTQPHPQVPTSDIFYERHLKKNEKKSWKKEKNILWRFSLLPSPKWYSRIKCNWNIRSQFCKLHFMLL